VPVHAQTLPGPRTDPDRREAPVSARVRAGVKTAARAHVCFEAVSVRYGNSRALVDFDLRLATGEAVALLGPSGSGKTTILRALAGFAPIESGRITIRGQDVSGLPPQRRGLGIVVQNYALFPHMSVADNVAFGLRARRAPRSETAHRVADSLAMVGMSGYGERRPHELSGGQQQRVALARALAIRPDVLLMDEPLSALDAPLRREMLAELIRLHRAMPEVTMLLVTHDQAEALALADRIGLLDAGKLRALDTPRQLYEQPPNRFADEFLGQTNLLRVELLAHGNGDGMTRVRLGRQSLVVRAPSRRGDGYRGYWLCLRPHHLSFDPGPSGARQASEMRCFVRASEWNGSHYRVTAEVEGQPLFLEASAATVPPEPGTEAVVSFVPRVAWLLPREE